MMISTGPITRQHIKLEVLETQCSPFQVPCFIWWFGWRSVISLMCWRLLRVGCYWADLGVSDAKGTGYELVTPLGYWRESSGLDSRHVMMVNGELI